MKIDKIKKASEKILAMKFPENNTKVIHSESKAAWNVVGTKLGGKYKIARVPYDTSENEELSTIYRNEALIYAQFISRCFNSLECEFEDEEI